MPEVIGEAFVAIRPQTTGFSGELNAGLGSSLKSFAGTMAGVLGGIGVASFFKGAIGEAQEAQKVAAQTAAVLKSTGGIANVTADEIDNLAKSLSKKTAIDDEVIASGENMLLTFTNIRNEVGKGNDIFDQATTAALDMSVALGEDLQSASIQVGKALQDPVAGVTALQRVGVRLTEQQKEQVKAFVANNDIMSAQKLILHELTTEFGGSAEAQATSLDKASVAFKNLEEAVGTALAPALNLVADGFAAVATGMGDINVLAGVSGVAIAGLAVHYGKLFGKNVIDGLQDIIGAFRGIKIILTDVVIPSVIAAADAFFAMTLAEQAAVTAGLAIAAVGIVLLIDRFLGGKSAADEFRASADKLAASWAAADIKAGGLGNAIDGMKGRIEANAKVMGLLRGELGKGNTEFLGMSENVKLTRERFEFLSNALEGAEIQQKANRAELERLEAQHKKVVDSADSVAKAFGIEIPAALNLTDKELKALTKGGLEEMVGAFGQWSAQALVHVGIVGDSFKTLQKQADDFSNSIRSSISSATNVFTHDFSAGATRALADKKSALDTATKDQLAAVADQKEALTRQTRDQEQALQDQIDAVDSKDTTTKAQLQGQLETLKRATQDQMDVLDDQTKGIQRNGDDQAKALEDAAKNANTAINQVEFEKFFVESNAAAAEWAEEITALIKKGVDVGIVQQMAAAGVQSKPQLDAFTKMVDDHGVEWVNSMGQRGKEAADAADAAFRVMVVATAVRLAEQKLLTDALEKDIIEGGTLNLQHLTTFGDNALTQMAFQTASALNDVRSKTEEGRRQIEKPIVISVDVQNALIETQKLIDKVNEAFGGSNVHIPFVHTPAAGPTQAELDDFFRNLDIAKGAEYVRSIRGYATGGVVQGSGGTDSVLARLTPGETVLPPGASAGDSYTFHFASGPSDPISWSMQTAMRNRAIKVALGR